MQRVLVIRLDFIGDMVCTSGLLSSIKKRWPTAELHVLANKYNRDVLVENPNIHAIHTYIYSKQRDRNEHPGFLHALWYRLLLIRRLRKLQFDLLVIPNGGMHKNSIQFARQLNVRDKRWHNAETEFDDRCFEHIQQRTMKHEALSGFALLPELGAVTPDMIQLQVYPDAELVQQYKATFGKKQRPRLGLFISNNSVKRRWSEDKWAALASELSQQMEILIFSDPRQKPQSSAFADIESLWVATPSVAHLIAAMTSLDVIVSPDSSPVHLGSALQIPTVALFEARPEKYLRWYPLVRHKLLYQGEYVNEILVQDVVKAIKSLLSEEQKISGAKEESNEIKP